MRAIPGKLLSKQEISKRYFGWNKFNDQLGPFKSGTSGHRGEVGPKFCEVHSKAGANALVDLINENGFYGPPAPASMEKLFAGKPLGGIIIGKDVRYVSDMIQQDVVDIFISNGIPVFIHKGDRSTPTPVVSFEILRRNASGAKVLGVIITASHNPPEDAGIKTNGFDGGPNTNTKPIDERANRYIANPLRLLESDMNHLIRGDRSVLNKLINEEDLITPYVAALNEVVDMDAIKGSGKAFGVTPIGGAACGYYEAINAKYGTDFKVFLGEPDPSGSFRTYDWDGKLRGDPSSKYVMMAVAGLREKNGLAAILANDNDADRFGVEDSTGIITANQALCVMADNLCSEKGYDPKMSIGRSIGTTHMLDEIAARYHRQVDEKNVGFKYYVEGLMNGRYLMAGEESAGFCKPRRDNSVWVTEKDGIVAVLTLMKIMASTGKDIGTLYRKLVASYGAYQYENIPSPATDTLKNRLAALASNPDEVDRLLRGKKIAGRRIERMVIGDGVKVVLEGGVWVLFRASGTEDIIKIYREEKGDDLRTATKATEELQDKLGLG